jgi:WD40 repeat protein
MTAIRDGALPRSQHWLRRILRPKRSPLLELATALQPEPDSADPAAVLAYVEALRARPNALDVAVRSRLHRLPPEARFVLAVDQFEEVFTQCADEAERATFVAALAHAATVPGGACIVVLTMRSDFIDQGTRQAGLANLLNQHVYFVPPLSEAGLRDAVERPARARHIRFEPGLVDIIVRDVLGQPGALPLLQFALRALWERDAASGVLTLDGYVQTGGVNESIARQADALFASLPMDQQAMARRALLRLTEPGPGTDHTRRRVGLDEIEELATVPAEQAAVRDMLRTLVDARLITTDRDAVTNEARVEVSHEALIRGWPRLRAWIDEDRAGLRLLRRLTDASQEWRRLNQDEGLLYRGARLAQAWEWRAQNESALNELERAFLDASQAFRERQEREVAERQQRELERARTLAEEQQRRAEAEQQRAEEQRRRAEDQGKAARLRGWLVIGLSVVLVLALSAAGYASWQRGQAQEQTRIAKALQLSAQGKAALDSNPPLGLLLGIEAARAPTAPRIAVMGSLMQSLAKSGGRDLLFQGFPVGAVAVSPDGRWLLAGADSIPSMVQLWDLSVDDPAAQRPRLLTGGPGRISGQSAVITISPNGRWLAASLADGSLNIQGIQLWDLTATDHAADKQHLLPGFPGPTEALAASRDGHWVAAGGSNGTIELWDLTHEDPTAQPPYALRSGPGAVTSVAISSDSRWLASSSKDGAISIWDLSETNPSTRQPKVLHAADSVTALVFSSDSAMLVAGESSGMIRAWDLRRVDLDVQPRTFEGIRGSVDELRLSPDGRWLVSTSRDIRVGPTLRLWDLTAPNPALQPRVLLRQVLHTAISDNGHRLIAIERNGPAHMWDLTIADPTSDQAHVFQGQWGRLVVSPDSRWLAAGADQSVHVWDLRAKNPSAEQPMALPGQSGVTDWIGVSPDNTSLLRASDQGTIQVWDLQQEDPTAQLPRVFEGAPDQVEELTFSPGGRWLIGLGFFGAVELWDLRPDAPSGQRPRVLFAGGSGGSTGQSLGTSPDGHWLAASDPEGTVRLWDLTIEDPAAQQPIVLADAAKGYVLGRWIYQKRSDRTARLWDLMAPNPASQEPRVLPGPVGSDTRPQLHDGHLLVDFRSNSIALWDLTASGPSELRPRVLQSGPRASRYSILSADGRWMLADTAESVALLWDLKAEGGAADQPRVLEGNGHDLGSELALSKDGHWAAVGAADGAVLIWDLADGNPLAHQPRVLQSGRRRVRTIAFSPDGAWLGVTDVDNTVHLWDIRTKDSASEAPIVLAGQPSSWSFLLFGLEGTWFVTGTKDALVVWDLRLEKLIRLACRTAGRNLTSDEWLQFMGSETHRRTCPSLPPGPGEPTGT